jgi:hypothetical protein
VFDGLLHHLYTFTNGIEQLDMLQIGAKFRYTETPQPKPRDDAARGGGVARSCGRKAVGWNGGLGGALLVDTSLAPSRANVSSRQSSPPGEKGVG